MFCFSVILREFWASTWKRLKCTQTQEHTLGSQFSHANEKGSHRSIKYLSYEINCSIKINTVTHNLNPHIFSALGFLWETLLCVHPQNQLSFFDLPLRHILPTKGDTCCSVHGLMDWNWRWKLFWAKGVYSWCIASIYYLISFYCVLPYGTLNRSVIMGNKIERVGQGLYFLPWLVNNFY